MSDFVKVLVKVAVDMRVRKKQRVSETEERKGNMMKKNKETQKFKS